MMAYAIMRSVYDTQRSANNQMAGLFRFFRLWAILWKFLTLHDISAHFRWSLWMNRLHINSIRHVSLNVETKTSKIFSIQVNSNITVNLNVLNILVKSVVFPTSLMFCVLNDFCVPASNTLRRDLKESILVIWSFLVNFNHNIKYLIAHAWFCIAPAFINITNSVGVRCFRFSLVFCCSRKVHP